ncbi:aldose 1-epimerase [Bacillus sp. JCM 19046]|nr:aldose 1-epimerase [Bacillus sp. JCM 19046]
MKAAIQTGTSGQTEVILENDYGMKLEILAVGATVTKLIVPDKDGRKENIVVSLADKEAYPNDEAYFGALIGPVAGRVKAASFKHGGTTYQLTANEGENQLHSGKTGFHQEQFIPNVFEHENEVGVTFTRESQQCTDGFPGKLSLEVRYTLSNENEWILSYKAHTDEMTPITLTNHTYFNLSGDFDQSIADHRLTMESDGYLELGKDLLPTGFIVSEEGPFQFQDGRLLGDGFKAEHEQIKQAGGGYDHFFFLKEGKKVIYVTEPTSGRELTVTTTQPGVTFYSGNGLDGTDLLADGKTAQKHGAFCLETQSPPASLHHKGLPSIWLKPGELYEHETIYKFGKTKASMINNK